MKHNANELTRFHANWQRATAREDDRSPDAQLADIQGQGRYVGTSLHVYQVIDGIWWGEGDEKIFIDGEKYPSWFGTGSEDYFGYAWCDSTEFDFPYNGQPWNKDTIYSGDRQLQERGDKINYRIHVTDNICFRESLEVNIEKYHGDASAKYGVTTWFYLTKQTSGNHQPVAVSREERLFNTSELDGATTYYPGIYMSYRFLASNTSVQPWVQSDMGSYNENYQWVGNSHMFWQPTAKGKNLEYLIELPESGRYSLKANMTTAPDYGIVAFYLDDVLLGTVDTFHAGGVGQVEKIMGDLELNAGAHVLRIEIAGKNLSSSGYYMGLNYLEFVPAQQQTNTEVYGGWRDLANSYVAEGSTGNVPETQGMVYDTYQWMDDAHLFWRSAAGDQANFEIQVGVEGTYTMEVSYTLANDFGVFDIAIDGKVVARDIDGSRVGGIYGEKRSFYNIELTAGKHILSLICKGAGGTNAGTFIGIDHIKLTTPQTQVGAFYGGWNDLAKLVDPEQTTATLAWQDLGWAATDTWYHNCHLVGSLAEGEQVSYKIELPADASYDLTLQHTVAGDFGKFDILIDGTVVAEGVDGFGDLTAKTLVVEAIELTAGEHTLTFRGAGKNDSSSGHLLGISYVSFLGQMSAQGEQQDGTPLSNIQAKAVEELRQYAKEALALSQELQADHIRLAMAWGMVDICAAADGDVPALLEAGKKEIDTVLATEYEEELEVDRIDDLFYEGAQMLDLVVSKTGDEPLLPALLLMLLSIVAAVALRTKKKKIV